MYVHVQELNKQETAYLSIFCEKIEKKLFISLFTSQAYHLYFLSLSCCYQEDSH